MEGKSKSRSIQLIDHLQNKCKLMGCDLKVTKMSDIYEDTASSFFSDL